MICLNLLLIKIPIRFCSFVLIRSTVLEDVSGQGYVSFPSFPSLWQRAYTILFLLPISTGFPVFFHSSCSYFSFRISGCFFSSFLHYVLSYLFVLYLAWFVIVVSVLFWGLSLVLWACGIFSEVGSQPCFRILLLHPDLGPAGVIFNLSGEIKIINKLLKISYSRFS